VGSNVSDGQGEREVNVDLGGVLSSGEFVKRSCGRGGAGVVSAESLKMVMPAALAIERVTGRLVGARHHYEKRLAELAGCTPSRPLLRLVCGRGDEVG
jgi:hypothetical protein